MQGSYRSARIVETRNLSLSRLRLGIWTVEKENRDLLIRTLPDIHRSMNAGARLLPLDLTRRDLDALALASVAVFDDRTSPLSTTATGWNGSRCHGISFAGSKAQMPPRRGSVVEEDFVNHSRLLRPCLRLQL